MNLKTKLALTAFMILPIQVSQAQVIAFYNDGSEEEAAALVNIASPVAGVTVTDLSAVGFVDSNLTRNSFAIDTLAGPTAGSAAGSEWFFARPQESDGVAGSADNYYGFTATADAGSVLNLTNLEFDFYSTSNDANVDIFGQAEAFVSIDGGAFTSFGSVASADDDGITMNNGNLVTANIDLSSIAGVNSVEVRIGIGHDGTTPPTTNAATSFLQGIEFNGSVAAVPEPAGLTLLGLLGAVAISGRRRLS